MARILTIAKKGFSGERRQNRYGLGVSHGWKRIGPYCIWYNTVHAHKRHRPIATNNNVVTSVQQPHVSNALTRTRCLGHKEFRQKFVSCPIWPQSSYVSTTTTKSVTSLKFKGLTIQMVVVKSLTFQTWMFKLKQPLKFKYGDKPPSLFSQLQKTQLLAMVKVTFFNYM